MATAPTRKADEEQMAGFQSVKELFVPEELITEFSEEAKKLKVLELTVIDVQWLQVLAEGWASPLTGFMNEDELIQCLYFGGVKASGGQLESLAVPIVLPVRTEDKKRLEAEDKIALSYKGTLLAILSNPEFYVHRKEERVCRQFGTHEKWHPYVQVIHDSGDWLVGGGLDVLGPIQWYDGMDKLRLTPNQLMAKFRDMKANPVYAAQLRHVLHNGNALFMNDTRQLLIDKFGHKNPVLLLHLFGGWTKENDLPLQVQVEQYRAMLKAGVIDPKTTVLAICPSPVMYAGPLEVLWHAKLRQTAGVTVYILGSNPMSVNLPNTEKPLYDPSHGKRVCPFAPGLSLQYLPFRDTQYDKTKKAMDFFDSSRQEDFQIIDRVQMRSWARTGKSPPEGYMDPEAWKVIAEYYQSVGKLDPR